MSMSKFYEDCIDEFVQVARSDGWDVMVKDAYTFVDKHCVWEDTEDKHMLVKTVIRDVGYELTNYKPNTATER
jgi:hypothetical protein